MPKVVQWSLGFVLVTCLAFAGALQPSANADVSAHDVGVAPVVAQASTTGRALADDEDPMARCNAPADSSTPGEGGYTAPAPMKLDASGADQDGICVPADFNHPKYSWGSYYVGTQMLVQSFYKTKGASSITVTTSYNSGTWTFKFSHDEVGTEAANKYRLKVAKVCSKSRFNSVRYRRVWAYVTNVADATVRSVSAYPQVEHVKGWYGIIDTEHASSIPDGDTAVMRVMETVSNGIPGLRPGKYRVSFWLSDTAFADIAKDYVAKHRKLVVPRCGKRHR